MEYTAVRERDGRQGGPGKRRERERERKHKN